MSYPIVLAHGVCRFDKVWSDALEQCNQLSEQTCMPYHVSSYLSGFWG